MSFLPSNYTRIPSNSNYFKFKDGENNFRVLSPAVVGYAYWNTENKPVRSREAIRTIPNDIKLDEDGRFSIRHFWAFVVWNYDEQSLQILEVTQKRIMTALKALVESPKWGDPTNYDITISRSGNGFDTEYIVQGNPPASLDDKVAALYDLAKINLEALFDGGDPFMSSTDQPVSQ